MYCVHCGTANPDTNKFCHGCGAELVQPLHGPAETDHIAPPLDLRSVGLVATQSLLRGEG
jgi:hypothetical protein